jgi:hypothetical protein
MFYKGMLFQHSHFYLTVLYQILKIFICFFLYLLEKNIYYMIRFTYNFHITAFCLLLITDLKTIIKQSKSRELKEKK